MLTIALAITPHTVPSSLAMALDVLRLGNRHAAPRPLAKLLRLSADGRGVDSPLGRWSVDGALDAAERADLLLFPAIGVPEPAVLQDLAPWIEWLRTRRPRRGAATLPRFASICSAAFVLGDAGLLDGRRATTHWSLEQPFRRRYPNARLAIDQMITHDGDIACSGGAYAGVDLCLHLLRLAGGETLARRVANELVFDEQRGPQRRHAPRLPAPDHEDAAIGRLQRWLDSRYAEPLTLAAMAEQLHCSPRSLLRRFKQATGLTPIDYLQRVRVSAAEAQLADPQRTVEAVAWAVGYEDRAAFAKVFKRITGASPASVRRRPDQ
ncbi:helix-turn-helix domain-containing protein [Aquincola sp. S2]|uniref:Helix-turn-helix domain-containing protein n=1 Tax=Pseudaquabacterium terrae TaxID=2732868 RepID=A0ABX2EAF3_9BURK|nr:helix-turn-helix domain-containing protein [Aquabacterium terrae]NRF66066.1 helix-turn-helix domain-containing protein [Aquabacterium terrae]